MFQIVNMREKNIVFLRARHFLNGILFDQHVFMLQLHSTLIIFHSAEYMNHVRTKIEWKWMNEFIQNMKCEAKREKQKKLKII